tara:strand:- start:1493 stop:2143 length:651 start_codon:yes stop_codon:yes gene_type:complete
LIEATNIIDYLTKSLNFKEKVSSSHWNYFHKDFKFENGHLSGLTGFGVLTKPYKWPFKHIHHVFQWIFRNMAIGDKRFEKELILINSKDYLNNLKSSPRYVAIEAENFELLKYLKKDLVINIASFQEMTKEVISNYFKFIYNKNGKSFYFYFCNRQEKELPGGEKINFNKYNFKSDDQILVNELCPWHQYFYTKFPPFFKNYDGTTSHQLRKINNS